MAQSRRDQLQAYRFMQRRVRAALLDADPDTNDAPLSRLGVATYSGIIVAILVLAVAGIYGVIRPGGSTAWKQPGSLIVERETSTRYVYLDNVLYQVANYASAKLLLGDRLAVVDVSQKSLAGARHGGSIGIPGAPDYVPAPDHIVGTSWAACVSGDLSATTAHSLVLQPGVTATGSALPSGNGMLLVAAGAHYLVWNNHAFAVADQYLPALRYGNAAAVTVSPDFVAAIPRGETLAPVSLSGVGKAGPALPGVGATKIGQVLQDTLKPSVFYLVNPTGLYYLTPLQAALQLAVPATRTANGRPSAISVDSTPFGSVTLSQLPARPSAELRGPTTIPTAVTPGAATQLCANYSQKAEASIVYGPQQAAPSGAAASGTVRLRTGYGALVGAVPRAGQSPTAIYLVTDTGQKFAVKGDSTLTQLGLSTAPVAALPGSVLAQVPGSVVLDPAAAKAVINGTSSSSSSAPSSGAPSSGAPQSSPSGR